MYNSGQLVVWNIEGAGRLQKFRALYRGENVAEVFNSAWAGKTMDQVVPMSLRRVPAQPVDATQALNLSAGVSNCKVSRGRSFS